MFHLEDGFGRKCFWALCLLHIGELFPRRLLEKLDGKTTGPNTYGGPIGRLLDTVSERPIIPDFAKVDRWPGPEIPREIRDEMCSDQQYFLRLCDIVRTGEVLHCKEIIQTSIIIIFIRSPNSSRNILSQTEIFQGFSIYSIHDKIIFLLNTRWTIHNSRKLRLYISDIEVMNLPLC